MTSQTILRTPIRAAVVGSGTLAGHLYNLSSQDDVDIIAITTTDPRKLGKKAADVFRVSGPDISLQHLDDVLDSQLIDVVIHAGPQDSVWSTFEQTARIGIDALTTAGAFFDDGSAECSAVTRLAERTGARLLGTGTFPGFTADTLPITLSRILPNPVDISIRLTADLHSWSQSVLKAEIGIGEPPREPDIALMRYVQSSAHMIALSLPRTGGASWEYRQSFLTSEHPLTFGTIEVAPGNIAGFSLHARALVGASVVDLIWESSLVGAPTGGEIIVSNAARGFEIETRFTGVPPYPATAVRLMNSVRPLRTLPAGLRYASELPVIAAPGADRR